MRNIVTVGLILFLSIHSFGQIINSHAPDKTGMFFYSFDSLMNILLKNNKFDIIHLRADESLVATFPNEHKGITILKMNNQKNIKSSK